MSFVGIISDNKNFKFIKNNVLENIKENKGQLEIIEITTNSIENMKNIKFETILITTNLDKFKSNFRIIENMLASATYLIINSDIDVNTKISDNLKLNIITYGLNQKSTITASSISENNVIICLQRNIRGASKKIIEQNEFNIKLENNDNRIIYNTLAYFSILLLYDNFRK